MRTLRLLLLLAAVLLPACAPTFAQDDESSSTLPDLLDMSLEDLMKVEVESVYAASRHQQKVTEAPASITVITSDQIQKYGYRTLAEVLRAVRGFFVTYDRNYNYVGVRGFNRPGDYGSRVLLLIDGHRVNDNIFDSAFIGTEFPLDPDLIDRIEVIRGPNTSLYVASAFLGVINVVSKHGRMVGSPKVSTKAGSFGSYKGRASYSETLKNGLEMLLSGSYYTSPGQHRLYFPQFDSPATNNGIAVNSDDDQSQQLFGNFSYRNLKLQALYGSREKGVPTAFYDTSFNDSRTRSTDIRSYLDLQYDRKLSAATDFLGRLYFDQYEYHGVNADFDPTASSYLNEDLSRGKWAGVELSLTRKVLEKHHFSAGAEFRRNFLQEGSNYDRSPFVVYSTSRNQSSIVSLYSQGEIVLSGDVRLNLGMHYDHYSTFGGTLNPRAGLIYNPFKKTTLKFLYAQAFRPPNDFELYYSSSTNLPNPSLQPETAKTTGVVLEQYVSRHTRFTVGGYYYPLRQLIGEETEPISGKMVFENSGSVDMRGVEFELARTSTGGMEASIQYSFQDLQDQQQATALSNVPKHLGGLKLSVPLLGKKLFASSDVNYVSRRRTLVGSSVPAYFLPNFTLFSQNIKQHWKISASLYNAFNSMYGDPGAPEHRQDILWQDGRTFRLKATFSF
jgi:outer membrane receptor for ferrienterochelin and colicins